MDCGEGNDTIYINPRNRPGGISNDKAIREGRIKNCENVIPQEAEVDPTKGITWQGDGIKHGTDRNDKLLGQHASNKLYGNAGDDILWADAAGGSPAQSKRAKDYVSGGPGNDTIYGGRGPTRSSAATARTTSRATATRTRSVAAPGTTRSASPPTRLTRVDAGPGDDLISAVISNGHATIKCGPGKDTVLVSKFKGTAGA